MRMDLDSKENMILRLKGSGSHGRWAVDAIAELEAEVARLREALAFIANTAGYGASAYVDVAAKALKGEER